MRLIYAHIRHFRNIENQEVFFSDDFDVQFDSVKKFPNGLTIVPKEKQKGAQIIHNGSYLSNVHIFVGKTGAGKTNLFQMIGIPIGTIIESITPAECIVRFHPKGGMERNIGVFGLEQRYERHAPEAHRLLLNRQNFTEEKNAELVKMGIGTRDDIISSVFGPQNPDVKKKTLRQKMLYDITGY